MILGCSFDSDSEKITVFICPYEKDGSPIQTGTISIENNTEKNKISIDLEKAINDEHNSIENAYLIDVYPTEYTLILKSDLGSIDTSKIDFSTLESSYSIYLK